MQSALLVFAIVNLLVIVLLAVLVAKMYRRCPPKTAMIISGMGAGNGERDFKILTGGGALVLPFVQVAHFLSLETMTLDLVPTAPFNALGGAPVNLTINAQVSVRADAVSITAAAEKLLGKNSEEIKQLVADVLLAAAAKVIGGITQEELPALVASLGERVQQAAVEPLGKLGLTILTLNIDNIKCDQASSLKPQPFLR